jgi:energy-coupling factor transport system ATP-binding protein/energy-coupling factor transport system substrate-specific component
MTDESTTTRANATAAGNVSDDDVVGTFADEAPDAQSAPDAGIAFSDRPRERADQARPHRSIRWTKWILGAGSLLAVSAFAWPFFVGAVPADAQVAVPIVAFALIPALIVALALTLDREMYTAQTVALLGVLSAVGAAVRIAGAGAGGVEAVFVLLILVSSALWGGFGPWTPFQMFACGWVAAGAGLLPRWQNAARRESSGQRMRANLEIALLAAYGVVASYLFGLIMNLWFWPFVVGSGTGISYEATADPGQNLASFALYSLVTSTLTWDTVRAITTVVGIALVGPAVLAALRRTKISLRS